MATDATKTRSIYNVPNAVTGVRSAMAIAVFAMIALGQYVPALVLFCIAAGTDWIDGWWARKYDQVTQFGRIFDPFADKMIICGTFIFLAAVPASGIPAWMAVVVVARELLVTSLRSFMERSGTDFSAVWSGKLKMGFQCAAIIASLVALIMAPADATTTWYGMVSGLPVWLTWLLPLLTWLAVGSTWQSGWEYLQKAWPSIVGR